MNFDSLKDQLKDQWAELLGKIQENSTFQTLKEKFESLSASMQRAIILAVVFLVGLFIWSIPYSYISSSKESLATFEENREIIRDLLQASRTLKEPSPLPPSIGAEGLKSQASSIFTEMRIVPEQIGEMVPTKPNPAGNIVPAVVQQEGLAISIKKLNLRQIVEIGHRLQALSSGIRLMGLDMVRSAGQTHYYDAVFRVVSFSLPVLNNMPSSGSSMGGRPLPGRRPPIRPAKPPAEESVEDEGEE